ncbi:carbohydrate ABC transporter permease [Rubellimicrobium arenae]|uniref:carbohydrate ABC transporter permease n=1 Tax=Rubellimicrobium arenae TaxID=2817372 RepID=UPI001B30114E|nr:carbohydrate ABC transporter permease [Rubellimicrobium arenae]
MRRSRISDVALLAAALFFTLISIAPLLWMALGAFKTTAEMIAIPPVWVPDFTYWSNFATLFTKYWPNIANSLIVTLGATLLAMILALPAAFALSTMRVRGRNAIADWILSTRMMPPIAAAAPLFILFSAVGLLGSLPAMVLAYAGFNLPFAIWVSMSFFRQVPKELIEAARLEGCSWFQVLTRVAIPLSLSGIATVATFVFIFAWNEFMLALFLSNRGSQTFPVVISSFIGTGRIYWDYIAAATVIQCLPPVLFAVFMQRHIVSGMTMGAVKD